MLSWSFTEFFPSLASSRDTRSLYPRWLRWVVGATGLVASTAIWWYAHSVETEIAVSRFEADAKVRIESIERELSSVTTAIADTARFLGVIREDVHEYFTIVSQPLIEREPTLQALGWDPIVRGEDRQRYEDAVRARGDPDFRITHRDVSGSLMSAMPAAEYVVVEIILPIEGNENAIGFDVASESRRREALESARRLGMVSATAPITLVQETENQSGLLVFAPVNRGVEGTIGFVVGVLRMGDAISTALEEFPLGSMKVTVQDRAAEGGEGMLFQNDVEPISDIQGIRSNIEYAGRSWSIVLDPGREYAPRKLQPAVLGFAAAAFVLLYLIWAGLADRRNLALREVIAQREGADAARARSEERFRLMVDSISDGGWDINLSSDVVIVSDGWLAGLGYGRDEAPRNVGDWIGLIHPDNRVVTAEDFPRQFQGSGGLYDETMQLRHEDGSYRWYRRRARVIDWEPDGHPRRVIGMDVDVTLERQQNELQEKLERKVYDSQKSDSLVVLAGGIAHDFNNLLVGVLGAADLALAQDPPEKLSVQLERIRDSGIRAVDLTRQMLIYAGRGEAEFEPADAREIITSMEKVLESSIGNRHELQLDLPETPAVAHCDPTQIRQLILNLVVNAGEAMHDMRGRILIRLEEVTLSARDLDETDSMTELKPGAYVRLDVVDSGSGFDADTKKRAFDPFFSTKDAGRGLGLASVLGIVRRHGGGIDVLSSEGATTLRVWLPRSDAGLVRTESRDAPAQSKTPHENTTVLVIDDEEMVREFMESALTAEGYRVVSASSGEEGIEVFDCQDRGMSLVLLDFNMPGMTGLQTFRKLTERDSTLPVVLMSGFTPDRVKHEQEFEGLAGFLQKPFRLDELLRTVQETMRG